MADDLTDAEREYLREMMREMPPDEIRKAANFLACLNADPAEQRRIAEGLGEVSRASPGLVQLSQHSETLLRAMRREARWTAVKAEVGERVAWTANLLKNLLVIGAALGAALWLLIALTNPERAPQLPPPQLPSPP